VDVVIAGGGWVGLAMAKEIAGRTSLSVVVLERGIGWQLIGYPGQRMSYREEIDQHPGEAWRRKPVSLADMVGHPVAGWEEEKD
jgi:choline dehydrogenase-like flavoprotein